jgi:hypothetical protein
VLARLVSMHGAPRVLRSDNGPEFVNIKQALYWSATRAPNGPTLAFAVGFEFGGSQARSAVLPASRANVVSAAFV